MKVRGQWACLYRAVDKHGNTIDFYPSPTRNTAAAKRFLGKAMNGLKDLEKPTVTNTDKAPPYAVALAELKKEGRCPKATLHRQASAFNITNDIRGEARIVERTLRLGASAMAEMVQLFLEQFDLAAA